MVVSSEGKQVLNLYTDSLKAELRKDEICASQ
jgi:hypothetical protein